MEVFTSPYLEAIQAIAGSTPGQKYTELNSIVRHAANHAKATGDASNVAIKLKDVPEPLAPLVRLEVARILKQKEVIAQALTSENPELLNRALRTDWFFRSSNKEYINIKFFGENLLPFVALNTRIKLLKNLVASFNIRGETELAEEFHALVTNLYGRSQAEPLLEACSEKFVWNKVYKEHVILTGRMLKSLFLRYPEMIIRYLKLAFPSDDNSYKFNLSTYKDFYPRLVKNYSTSMIEILEARNQCSDIKLSKKAIDRFLKLNMYTVLKKPGFFTQMIPMKTLTEKITPTQYKILFANIFPKDIKKYSYRDVEEYLRYYPEDEKISLLLETYEKVYDCSMLDNSSLVTEEVMLKLSVEERVRQARIKLDTDNNCLKSWSLRSIWRCYLPKDEVLPVIKKDITKHSSTEDRSCLLSQMIFVCFVNNDKQELLHFLKYFTTHHRNEISTLIFNVMNSLCGMFNLETLSLEHWSIIEDFLKYLEVKDLLKTDIIVTNTYMYNLVYINLSNNRPIDRQLKCLLELQVKYSHSDWCMFPNHPEYDKLCFEKFIEMLPVRYPKNHRIWIAKGEEILKSIVYSIYSFNERHKEEFKNSKMEKLSLRNYKWLFEEVKKMMTKDHAMGDWEIRALRRTIRDNEPDIFEEWFPRKNNLQDNSETEDMIVSIDTGKAKKLLKKNSARILTHIDEYFECMKNFKNFRGHRQLFIKACKWHQEIPVKLFANSLINMKSKDPTGAILILALLVEGSVFEKIVEPFLPRDTKALDINDKNTKSMYRMAKAIALGMNYAKPAVSLDLVGRLCDGEFLSLGLVPLSSVSYRTPVKKVEAFAKKLAMSRVSVKKHGIRLYCTVATVWDYRNFLTSLWKKEKHKSIRIVVFKKIYELFLDELDSETWKLLENCISGMTVDDTDFLAIILDFDKIPRSFLPSYIPLVWQSVENLREQGFDKKIIHDLTLEILQAISGPMCKVLPDEFANKLFRQFFCIRFRSESLISTGMTYTLNGYLRADETKFEMRLKIFHDFVVDFIKKDWNVESTVVQLFYPTNWLIQRFVHHQIKYAKMDQMTFRIMTTMLEIFCECFDDMRQIYFTFTYLYVGIGLQGSRSPDMLSQKFTNLYPALVDKISPDLIVEIIPIISEWIDKLVITELQDETVIAVVKSLIDIDTRESLILAVKLLVTKTDMEHALGHRDIFLSLRNSRFPAVACLAMKYFDIRSMPVY